MYRECAGAVRLENEMRLIAGAFPIWAVHNSYCYNIVIRVIAGEPEALRRDDDASKWQSAVERRAG